MPGIKDEFMDIVLREYGDKIVPKIKITEPLKMWQPDPRYINPNKLKELMEEIIKEQGEQDEAVTRCKHDR